MESSACRRRASDADQSAWSSTVTVKCEPVMVKVEPEWDECGVSEAAAAGGLYAGHRVKDELVFEPVLIQQQDIIQRDIPNALDRMKEDPCSLKVESDTNPAKHTVTCPGDGLGSNGSTEQQLLHRSQPFHNNYVLSRTEEDACKLKPAGEAAPATESTRAQSDLTTRAHTHTGQKPHRCDVCHKQFKYRSFLVRHLRTHTGEKPFCCDFCNKMFTQKATLIGHIHTHTGEKTHICNVCNRQFRKRSTLMKHMRIHPDEKPYSCDVCDKRFTHRAQMISHKLTHTDENPFSCNICNKQFTRKSALVKHIRTHTGEKPYSCEICSRRFTVRHHLSSHIRIHTGEKPYKCFICDKRFARRRTMTLHIRKHTGHIHSHTGYILTVEPFDS